MVQPGRLIASGRDADIFELGPDRVLRRARSGRSMAAEARIMVHVRDHGFPVPEVHDISDDGTELVMERIDGPTMVDDAAARPWRVPGHGARLADLHQRLHELPAPDWLAPAPTGPGGRIVHLDLHPLNVLVSAAGPVVIDWANAAAGDPAADVAVTWALVTAGDVPSSVLRSVVVGVGRRTLLGAFLRPFDLDEVRPAMAAAVGWKAGDPNMSSAEIDRMRRLADDCARRSGGHR